MAALSDSQAYSVAAAGHEAVVAPGSKLKQHIPMKRIYLTRSGKRPSAAQGHAWGAFGGASCGWGSLTEDQFRAWDAAAKQEKRRRHWPQGRRLTGQNLFTEINSHQAFLGLPPLLDPPEHPVFSLDRLGPLSASARGGGIALTLSVPKVPTEYILLYAARPCNAGRRYCDKLRYLEAEPSPTFSLYVTFKF